MSKMIKLIVNIVRIRGLKVNLFFSLAIRLVKYKKSTSNPLIMIKNIKIE